MKLEELRRSVASWRPSAADSTGATEPYEIQFRLDWSSSMTNSRQAKDVFKSMGLKLRPGVTLGWNGVANGYFVIRYGGVRKQEVRAGSDFVFRFSSEHFERTS